MNALQVLTVGRRNGVSPANLHALLAVMSDPPMRPTDIAEICGVSNPCVTQAVDALEKIGFIERVGGSQDRRAKFLVPSELAFQIFASVVHDLEDKTFSLPNPGGGHIHASDASLQNVGRENLTPSLP